MFPGTTGLIWNPGHSKLNGTVLIIYLNKKSFLKFDNCNNDGLEAYLHVSNLQTTMFDNTLCSCCVVNLKVSIIRGGGGYVISKEIFEYPPPAVFVVPEIQ